MDLISSDGVRDARTAIRMSAMAVALHAITGCARLVGTPLDGAVVGIDGAADTGVPSSCESTFTGCYPISNTGCQRGQNCYVDGMRSGRCAASPGVGVFGSICVSSTDCDVGLSCLFGFCQKYCCEGSDPTPCQTLLGPRASCGPEVDLDSVLGLCTVAGCSVHTQEDCPPAANNCVYVYKDLPVEARLTLCRSPTGRALPNQPCARQINIDSDCPQGFTCYNAGPGYFCRRYCDPLGGAVGSFSSCPDPTR